MVKRFGLSVTSTYRSGPVGSFHHSSSLAFRLDFPFERKIFDWATECPGDFVRSWPPVVGRGRGRVLRKDI
jgi:hypothetical protein